MGEAESHGEEPAGGREVAREAGARARLRAQAELAWTRVQQAVQRGHAPALPGEKLLEAADRVPTAGYLAGVAVSLMVSTWLSVLGRRTAGVWIGVSGPVAFALGLYAKLLRRSRR